MIFVICSTSSAFFFFRIHVILFSLHYQAKENGGRRNGKIDYPSRLSQLPVPSHYLAIELSCNGKRTRFSSLPIPYPTYQLVQRRLPHRSPPGTLVSLLGSFFDMSAFAAFPEAVAFFADTLHATPRSSCRCSGTAKYLPSPLFWLIDWSLDAVRCGRQVPRAQIQNLAASTSIVFSSFLPLLSHDHNYNCDHTTAIIHTDDNYNICLILPLPTTTAHHHRSPLLPTARHRLLPPPKS
jgi:hypothetical protein